MKASMHRNRVALVRAVTAATLGLTLLGVGVGARRMIADEGRQADAFVALGGQALAHGDRATAVVAFERARWIAPRAANVRAAIASASVRDVEGRVVRTLRWLTAREWTAVAIGFGWLAGLGLASLILFGRHRLAARLSLASGGAFVLALVALVTANHSSPAIVVGTDARLFVAPYGASAVTAALPTGSMILCDSTYGDFVHADAGDGGSGWIARGAIERVAAPGG